MRQRHCLPGVCIFLLLFQSSPSAVAFGTVKAFGQNAEHSRITRHALACTDDSVETDCFEPGVINSLAGKLGSFGALGAPDRSRRTFISYAHCSAGDYLEVSDYPRTKEQAEASLTACRNDMRQQLEYAVADAARLLDKKGRIRRGQLPGMIGCIYAVNFRGRAKCDVLGHFGIALHAAQDFYAHSNWVDVANDTRPISRVNPPGLGQRGRAPWLDLRVQDPDFPDGLISACGDIDTRFEKDGGCKGRISHGPLNKDNGPIDPEIGQGTTPRGAIHDNFRHAVEAAIEDTIDKWAMFQERLIETYGEERGERMICVITRDNPVKDCA